MALSSVHFIKVKDQGNGIVNEIINIQRHHTIKLFIGVGKYVYIYDNRIIDHIDAPHVRLGQIRHHDLANLIGHFESNNRCLELQSNDCKQTPYSNKIECSQLKSVDWNVTVRCLVNCGIGSIKVVTNDVNYKDTNIRGVTFINLPPYINCFSIKSINDVKFSLNVSRLNDNTPVSIACKEEVMKAWKLFEDKTKKILKNMFSSEGATAII